MLHTRSFYFIFIIIIFSLFLSNITNLISEPRMEEYRDQITTETMNTIKELNNDSFIVLAGNGASNMMLIAGNKNHIQYETLYVELLHELLYKNNSVFLITYKDYFDETLNFYPYYFPPEPIFKGSLLMDNFKVVLVDSKQKTELYQIFL